MTAASIRDVVIIIFGITGTIGLIFMLAVMYCLLKKMRTVQASITATMAEARKVIGESKEAIKPIMQIAAIIDAARSGIDLVKKIFEMKKGGGENDRESMG